MNTLTPSDFPRGSTRIPDAATALLQGKWLERPDDWYPFFTQHREPALPFVSLVTAIEDMADGGHDKSFTQLLAALAIGDTAGFIHARTMLAREYAEAWVNAMDGQGAWADDTDPDSYDREQFLAWRSDRAPDARAHNASLRNAA